MSKILVTYASLSGSTVEVARAIGEEITQQGKQVDVLPLEEITGLGPYEAVVIGAPMIMGWHRSAQRFLRKNRTALQGIPLAIFLTALSLTSTGEKVVDGVPMCVDENLAKALQKAGRPTFKERYSDIHHYVTPILKAASPARPVSLALFGGSLDYRRLKIPAMLFVMLVIQAQPGDRRNWPTIRGWAKDLPALFDSIH